MGVKRIEVKGAIVSDDYKEVYEWFGIQCTCPGDVNRALTDAMGEDLEVIINSGGGEVYAGSEIYTALKDYPGRVIAKIVGLAASAASVIAMAGEEVLISPTAQIMIHNVSSVAAGDYRDMVHESAVLKNYNQSIANAYKLKTGLNDEDLLEMMNEETWLNAQQAVEKGFADSIMFDEQRQLVASQGAAAVLPLEVIDKMKNHLAKLPPKNVLGKSEINRKGDETMELTIEILAEKHPDVYAAVKQEGHDEGVKAERARIKAIDEIAVPGATEIVDKAKYETGASAEQVAVEIIKAERQKGSVYLQNVKTDAADVQIHASETSADDGDKAELAKATKAFVDSANARR